MAKHYSIEQMYYHVFIYLSTVEYFHSFYRLTLVKMNGMGMWNPCFQLFGGM